MYAEFTDRATEQSLLEQVQQQIVDAVRRLRDAGEITVSPDEEVEEFIQ